MLCDLSVGFLKCVLLFISHSYFKFYNPDQLKLLTTFAKNHPKTLFLSSFQRETVLNDQIYFLHILLRAWVQRIFSPWSREIQVWCSRLSIINLYVCIIYKSRKNYSGSFWEIVFLTNINTNGPLLSPSYNFAFIFSNF